MKTTRREFLTTASTAAVGAGILLGAAACSDSETSSDPTGGGGSGAQGCSADIGTNHGHELVVPELDVTTGTDKTYSIQGSSPHDHEVTLTSADFTALAGGGSVTVTATSDGTHDHEVTVTCA